MRNFTNWLSDFRNSISDYGYYIDFDKVYRNVDSIKIELEMNTVWSFPNRGKWSTHDAKYRGNWSAYIPRNLILRYSSESDLVLDQFIGGGTTLVEAKLLNRNIIGVDINPSALERCREKTAFEWQDKNKRAAQLQGNRFLEDK